MKTRKLLFILLLTLINTILFAQKTDIFKPEFIKARMEKVTKWQLGNPKHQLTDWTNGAFYTGVFAAYETTRKQWILDSLMAMGERTQWKPGKRFDHADDITISQTYIDLYRIKKDERMIRPTLDTLKKVQTTSGNEIARHGISWWWCDALFMAPPTFAKLAKETGDKSLLATSDKFFKECYDLLYNTEEHLFARDASYLKDKNGNIKLESNGKKIFWSRGNGWVVGGLVKLLKELPKDHPTRAFYLNNYKEMCKKLLELQQEDGLWRSSLLDPAAYPGGEGSGSGFDIYAMAWGVNNGILDKKTYLPAIKKGWEGLNTLVQENGKVGWVQPIGADPRRNFDAESWEVYGSGAYLLAGSEVIKLK
jgi:unsaturated rhamnogalacturonyl hydrolase